MRGELLDFNRLVTANGATPALGNANKNARGDLIDRTGAVLRTQEQIEEEYARRKAQAALATSNMDIKSDLAPGMVPQQTPKQALIDDRDFEPPPLEAIAPPIDTPKTRNRKMTDAE